MIIKNDILQQIKSYAITNKDKEVCGFLVEDSTDLAFIPIENKHPDDVNFFVISPKDYLKICEKYKIHYLFHSHYSKREFSEIDLSHQKYHNINMLLYVIETDEFLEMKCK